MFSAHWGNTSKITSGLGRTLQLLYPPPPHVQSTMQGVVKLHLPYVQVLQITMKSIAEVQSHLYIVRVAVLKAPWGEQRKIATDCKMLPFFEHFCSAF